MTSSIKFEQGSDGYLSDMGNWRKSAEPFLNSPIYTIGKKKIIIKTGAELAQSTSGFSVNVEMSSRKNKFDLNG